MTLPPGFVTLYARLDRQGPGLPEEVRWAVTRLGLCGALRVCDAGCGTGRHALRLVKYFHRMQVTAMDLSASALGYAQVQAEHHHLPVDVADDDGLADLGKHPGEQNTQRLAVERQCFVCDPTFF